MDSLRHVWTCSSLYVDSVGREWTRLHTAGRALLSLLMVCFLLACISFRGPRGQSGAFLKGVCAPTTKRIFILLITLVYCFKDRKLFFLWSLFPLGWPCVKRSAKPHSWRRTLRVWKWGNNTNSYYWPLKRSALTAPREGLPRKGVWNWG